MIIYIKHLWIIKEVTFSAKSTTGGKGIEDGKLVILVGSFLCKYNLLLLCCLWLFGRSLYHYRWKQTYRKRAESMLEKILSNLTSEPLFRCSILPEVPHHDENGINLDMKKKFVVTVNWASTQKMQPGSASLRRFKERKVENALWNSLVVISTAVAQLFLEGELIVIRH